MSRLPYNGTQRKLLLAFDVGTTFSGISYSILDPGKVPKIEGVNKFPGQGRAGGDAKIPTVLYYGPDGMVRKRGAETDQDGIDIIAEEENWIKAEWFKLHLRPKVASSAPTAKKIPALPLGKTVVQVLANYLAYMKECAKEYIEEHHPGIGSEIWRGSQIDYILSHPNGWEGPQQSLMRDAAIKAGLVEDTPEGRDRISFIFEGEASMNCCIERGLMNDSIRKGEGVTIVDAGGGTLDISAYAATSDENRFQEIAEAQCHFEGSIFVTQYAKEYLEKLLKDSRYYRDIPDIIRYFDKNAKHTFRDPDDPVFIKIGSLRDRDAKLQITAGKLKLSGKTVASFFEPAIKSIVDGVLSQRRTAHKPISNVFLVGGFAANDYLFKRLKSELTPHGLNLYRPDTQLNKVVADGAISGKLDNPVQARVSKYAFGVVCHTPYIPWDPEHIKRKAQRYESITGESVLPGSFSVILHRNTQVSETKEFRCAYFRNSSDRTWCTKVNKAILCYRGTLTGPDLEWLDNDPNNFGTACTVQADLSNISVPLRSGPHGQFYESHYDVILRFGLAELKAQIAWKENGEEKRSPAELIYDTDL